MRPKYRILRATVIALAAVLFLTSGIALAVDKCDPTKCTEVCKVPCKTSDVKTTQANATVTQADVQVQTVQAGDKDCCKADDGKCCKSDDANCCKGTDGTCPKGSDGKCCQAGDDKTCPKSGEACCQKNATKASADGATCPKATSGCCAKKAGTASGKA